MKRGSEVKKAQGKSFDIFDLVENHAQDEIWQNPVFFNRFFSEYKP